MSVSALSSNWKTLQNKLNTEKRSNGIVNGAPDSTSSRRLSESKVRARKRKAAESAEPLKRRRTGMSSPALACTLPPRLGDRSSSAPKVAPSPATASDSTSRNAGKVPAAQLGRYLALDCEMVATALSASSLARVSIVNYHGQLVYDSFVLPSQSDPVTDYKTFVSGITPSDLRRGYARPAPQVRSDVASLLEGRVLVGHAIKNDLDVLALSHPGYAIRDTARHAAHRALSGGKSPALKLLASKLLGLEIQDGKHDSIIDARTTMELFKREKGSMEAEVKRRYGRLVERAGSAILKGQSAPASSIGAVDEAKSTSPGTVAPETSHSAERDEEGSPGLLDGESDADSGIPVLHKESNGTAARKKRKKRRHKSRTTRA